MVSKDVRRWLGSRFATSWQLMALLSANYIVNGQLLSGVELVQGGPPGYFYDLFNSFAMVSILLIYRVIPISHGLGKSLAAWTTASAVSNLTLPFALPMLFETIDAATPEYRDFVVLASLGFFQTILLQGLLTVLLASFSESRTARASLAKQRHKLDYLKTTLEKQILEISERLEVDVKAKLETVVHRLLSNLAGTSSNKQLASSISDALNGSVRPLSWEIADSAETEPDFSSLRPRRTSMRERLSFKVEIGKSTSVITATAILAIYNLPLIYWVYGLEALPAGAITIGIVAAGVGIAIRALRGFRLNGVAAMFAIAALAGAFGLSVLLIRTAWRGVFLDQTQLGVVVSFMQIYFAVSWFRISLERRKAAVEDAALVNEELAILVTKLRQEAWIQKSKLARVIHGPVQSKLFAIYLELSGGETLEQARRQGIAESLKQLSLEIEREGENSSLGFEEFVDQLIQGWGDSLRFNVNLSSITADAIDSTPIAKACTFEILREGINNAAKYGDGEIRVKVEISDSNLLKISVTNQTKGADPVASSGYGSKILDEVAHTWNLALADGRAVFTATVPLGK